MEFDRKLEQWSFLTADNKYWSVEAASGIQASSSTKLVVHDDDDDYDDFHQATIIQSGTDNKSSFSNKWKFSFLHF